MPKVKTEKTNTQICFKRKNTIKSLEDHFTTISFHPPLKRAFIQYNF